MKAELCPVCLGSGKYKLGTCHGCNGKGWIVIPEDIKLQYKPKMMFKITER